MNRRLMKYVWFPAVVSLLLPAMSFTDSAATRDERLASRLRLLEEKAGAGDAEAMFRLARLFESGYDSIPADTLRSISLYREAAAKGFSPAENYYGFLLYNGVKGYLEADPDSAVALIEKAADKGDPKAANNLGWLFLEGNGIAHDPEKAAAWFSKAASMGLPAAKAQLADLLREGKGLEKDTAKAEKLYIEAIGGGISDAEDKLLSMMHESYMKLPAREALVKGLYLYLHRAPWAGVLLFERASEAPSDSAVTAHALALLGDASSRAQGVPYNHAKSMEYFHKAALLGNPSAQYIIAEHLDLFPDYFAKETADKSSSQKEIKDNSSDKEETAETEETAAGWYSKAAEAGITTAEAAWRALYQN